ncbi:hypothetical protein [Nitrosomonas oligotropha]|uniref:hypothetical protein n=1 Tax=Nitrosomonas oligotropha TaxID=42354 RepID=UPI000B7E9052|nr:hypothetical protein [Nitrosomonas oligotropha]
MSKKHNVLCINISQKDQTYSEIVGDSYGDEMSIAKRITISSCELDDIPDDGANFDKDETTKDKYLCLRTLPTGSLSVGKGEFDAILITKIARSKNV